MWGALDADRACGLTPHRVYPPTAEGWRAALELPVTTHQLGVLVQGGLPTVHEQTVKDELRFLVRVNQRRYRARHRLAIKVAENLEVPIARARVLLREIRT